MYGALASSDMKLDDALALDGRLVEVVAGGGEFFASEKAGSALGKADPP